MESMENKRNKANPFTTTPTSLIPSLPNPNFRERGRRIRLAAELGLAQSSHGHHWSRALRRRLLRRKPRRGCCFKKESMASVHVVDGFSKDLDGGSGDEKVEIERRVKALQRLVPGGEALGMERLFEETADYIEALEGQVNAMKALASFLDGLEREKRMVGGL